MMIKSKSRLTVWLIGFAFVYILFNRIEWAQNRIFNWDISGYYMYLPAIFIYQDLENVSFFPEINGKYKLSGDVSYYGLYKQEKTGFRVNKYPVGVAIFEAPFFFFGHWLTIIRGDQPADGFSIYYQLSVWLATVFWVIMGLIILRNFLCRYFDDWTVVFTIILTVFGTNLFAYTDVIPGMSHSFSFFLFAAVLNLNDKWHSRKEKWTLLLMGLTLGWVVITRPTNIIIFLVPVLWNLHSQALIKEKLALIRKQIWIIIGSLVLFICVLFIQLIYWKYITGDWVHYSYEGEFFNFAQPEIWNGLFSYRKGWFLWTPLAFISFFGFVPVYKYYRGWLMPILLFFLLDIYIVFSWNNWWYGGGFGCRPLIDALPLLAVPLACLVQWIKNSRKMVIRAMSIIIFSFVFLLSVFQTYQYSIGILPWDATNSKYYWRVFGKLKNTGEDWKLLKF
jgi:hypothetical protein